MRTIIFDSRVYIILIILIIFLFVFKNGLHAQGKDASFEGVVQNSNQEPIQAVSVILQNTKINFNAGTSTDSLGKFKFSKVPEGGPYIITFSAVGYEAQTLAGYTIKNSVPLFLTVNMKSSASSLDQVIIVGYGTQKKANLTGAISTVSAEDLVTVPTPTIVQSVMGRVPGVFAKIKNSQPGDYSGVSYNIRGFGEALIIIDGMPATNEEFLLLDPNDIEQFNVLKDAAAAAVYGARAGNGVILIKTKHGKTQQARFSYKGNYGIQQITMLPSAVNSWQNAQFENVALENAGLAPKWSQDDINKYKANNDPDYPNTDWWNLTLRKNAPQSQHNLSVIGGSDKVKYFISGGLYDQEGQYKSNDLKNKKYNLRTNLDVALTNKLDIGIDLAILANDYVGPSWDMAGSYGHLGIMELLYRSRPQYPSVYPDPAKLAAMGNDDLNPISATRIADVGYYKWNSFASNNKFRISYKLPFNITAKGLINYVKNTKREKRYEKIARAYWYDYDSQGNIQYHNHRNFNKYNWLAEDFTGSQNLNQQYILTWDGKFGDHKLSILSAYEKLSSKGDNFNAQRIDYTFDIDYLFAGPDLNKSNNGSGWQDGRVGQILSINYDYKGKYLFDFNARRDGSPKFPANSRWGLFPSLAVAWRISQEDFLKFNSIISNLKLRASWGKLGYDQTGNYQYLSTYSIKPAELMIDGVVRSGINQDNIPNLNITWEKITTSNIGLDFSLFSNKVIGTVDVFYRKRSDVLGKKQISLPDIVGASMPAENIEEYSNRGIEFSLSYAKRIGDLGFEIGGNMSYSRERVEYIDQPVYASDEERRRLNKIGEWSDQKWGYQADGVFTSQDEINHWAIIDGKNNATIHPGDIKYIDYNGDGIINSADNVIVGRGTTPDLIFGLTGNASWKGLDFSMLWQGASLFDIQYGLSNDFSQPFIGGNAPFLEMYKYSYTPENSWGIPTNTDGHPLFPRYYWPGYPTNNTNANSSFWYKNGTYLRLKSIELGYNLPKNAIDHIGVKNIKLYASGYNVLTFAALNFLDPELEANSGVMVEAYPPIKTYSFGIIIDF